MVVWQRRDRLRLWQQKRLTMTFSLSLGLDQVGEGATVLAQIGKNGAAKALTLVLALKSLVVERAVETGTAWAGLRTDTRRGHG
jgi:hypothetical protein